MAPTELAMPKRMVIDASHPEETRVVVIDGNRVEEFDFESAAKRPLKGNIYLAKVTRVEPSLQAAFVEYGGNRQGFLAFSEIHPDYYQIPVADRMAILQAQTERMMAEEDIEAIDTRHSGENGPSSEESPHGGNSESEERPSEEAAGQIPEEFSQPVEMPADVQNESAEPDHAERAAAQQDSIQENGTDIAPAEEIIETGGATYEPPDEDVSSGAPETSEAFAGALQIDEPLQVGEPRLDQLQMH